MFASSRAVGRIPVLAILGEAGSGKTTFLKRLLRSSALAHSVVIMTGAVAGQALDYPQVRYVPALGEVSEDGCLCCGMRSGLGDALREIFLGALSRRHAPVERVLIEADCLDPASLKLTLRHAPFLGQRYIYRTTFLVLDAEHITRHGLDLCASGLQYADVVVLSKSDLIPAEALQQVIFAVKQLNAQVKIVLSSEGVEALLPNTLH